MKAIGLVLAAAAVLSACGGSSPAAAPPVVRPSTQAIEPAGASEPSPDSLGPKPELGPPVPFVPPAPVVLDGPGHSKIWLLERHNLPLTTVAVVVPYGSAVEPKTQAGLAFATADMLDEGAGDRDALAFSEAVNDLGAKLSTSADRDASVVSVEVLADKLEPALALLSDAIVRPRHAAKDWTRVSALWVNSLKNRAHEPNEVARIATTAAFYGDHAYGHPPDGTLASANRVLLKDIGGWHKRIWRPDVATYVVVGDVTAERITSMLGRAFAAWKAPVAPPLSRDIAEQASRPAGLRTFIVDRADVPQVVMSIASAGPRAGDPVYPRLGMLNIALGGSFTSRLNQNLREDHGWTYGARSRFNAQRGPGMFVARAAVRADAIGPALGEARKEIERLAKEGLADAEVEKLRALLNGEALETYGTVHGAGGSLAGNAALDFGPDEDAKDLASQRSATAKDLSVLAAKYLDMSSAIVVLVGPKQIAEKALSDNGLPKATLVDADGKAIAGP